MPWHYDVSRQSEYVKHAETHRQRFKHKWYAQYEAKTNSEIFQNHALDIMSRMTEPHVAMPAKQQSFVSTNITIIVIHPVQNCRNMVVNYVLHPHDIIMERYAYKNTGGKRIAYLGDPTPISIQKWHRHEWLTRWNSGVTVKWINYYCPLSYITNPILHEPHRNMIIVPVTSTHRELMVHGVASCCDVLRYRTFHKITQLYVLSPIIDKHLRE